MKYDFHFIINILRKARKRRLDFDAPLTLLDLKQYRYELVRKGDACYDDEKQEIEFLTALIRFYDTPCANPNFSDTMERVTLSIGLTNEIFEALLPQFCSIINNENEWVCLYHIMIYRGWMAKVHFYVWVDWLNDRLSTIGKNEVLDDSGRRKVCKYLTKPEKYTWTLEEYQKAKGTISKQSANTFKRLYNLCEQIDGIFEGVREDDKIEIVPELVAEFGITD